MLCLPCVRSSDNPVKSSEYSAEAFHGYSLLLESLCRDTNVAPTFELAIAPGVDRQSSNVAVITESRERWK